MGPYRQDACRWSYQDPTLLKARGIDKAIKFGGYSTLNCYVIKQRLLSITLSLYLYLFSIALTTPLNLGGCVTVY